MHSRGQQGGKWTFGQVEDRLIEWASVLMRLPDREAGWIYGSERSWWPEVPKDMKEEWVNAVQRGGQYEDARPPRLPATRQEIARYEEASEWLTWIASGPDRKLTAAVAMWLTRPYERINWKWVSRHCGVFLHRNTLRRRYQGAVMDIVARLNRNAI